MINSLDSPQHNWMKLIRRLGSAGQVAKANTSNIRDTVNYYHCYTVHVQNDVTVERSISEPQSDFYILAIQLFTL